MTLFTAVDVETTGTDPAEDALVEIGAIDIADGKLSDAPRSSLVYPGRNIPAQAMAVHHIIEADVMQAPRAIDIVPEILQRVPDGIFVAHNASFEAGFLKRWVDESHWLCTYKAALRIYPEAPAHNLQTLRYWLDLPVDRKIADQSHRALPDAIVCAHLLLHLMEKASVDDMLAWTNEPPKLPTCPIGKEWRGKPWAEVDTGFLKWMCGQKDMEPDYVWNALDELKRRSTPKQKHVSLVDTKTNQSVDYDPETGEIKDDVNTQDVPEPNIAKCRQAYVDLALAAAALGQSYPSLLTWFKNEEANRERWGIQKGDDDYNKILDACKARKVELEKAA